MSYEKLHDFVEQEQIFKLIENANLSFDNEQLNQYFHIKVNPKVASYRQKKETIELSFPQEKLYHRYRNRFDLKQQAIYELAYGFEGREKLLLRDIKVKGTKGYYNPKSLDSIINKMTRVLKRYQEWEIIKRELELYDDILTEQEKQCMVLSYGLYQPEMLHDDEIRTYLESPELDIKREKTKAFQKMKLVVKRKRI
ncbi:MAG: hypothetical protein KH135_04165 [Firmicutes bacterium]|nr:hypothetical protein [Bacillota bacterium]